jgi:hypothetical protein
MLHREEDRGGFPFGSAIGGLGEGLTKGYLLGTKIREGREKSEAAAKAAKLKEEKGKREAAARFEEKGQNLIKLLGSFADLNKDGTLKIPQGTRRLIAPHLLKAFIDTTTEQGKAVLTAVMGNDPVPIKDMMDTLTPIIEDKELLGILAQDKDFLQMFSNRPLAAIQRALKLKTSRDTALKADKTRGLVAKAFKGPSVQFLPGVEEPPVRFTPGVGAAGQIGRPEPERWKELGLNTEERRRMIAADRLRNQGHIDLAQKVEDQIFELRSKLGPKEIKVESFVNPVTRESIGCRKDDSACITKALEDGKLPINIRLQDLGGFDKATRNKLKSKALENTDQISKVHNLLTDLMRHGRGAVGLRAWAAEIFGGLAGNINKDLGYYVSKAISDLTPQEIAAFRLKSQRLIAGEIESITGEQSGRISEPERELTQEAIRAKEPTASFEQVVGSLTTLIKLRIVNSEANNIKSGKPLKFDVSSDPAIDKTFAMLSRMLPNLGVADVDDLIIKLITQNRIFDGLTQDELNTPLKPPLRSR